MSFPIFPAHLHVVNHEQLEAEFQAGCHVAMFPTVSLTTLAHLVMAAQYAMQAPSITAPSFAVLNAFVNEALGSAPFPPETSKLIEAGQAGGKVRKGDRAE